MSRSRLETGLRTLPHYRPDIDGLRAVSVISVFAFHLNLISGGFVGVDVFFVISGYLITGILNNGMHRRQFTFQTFYERRARRILPALLVVVTATAIAAYVLLYPGDYEVFGQSALAALFGVSNVFFLRNTGYFDVSSQHMPLLHTWSLGVEEQFYLIWPAMLFGASRLFGRSKWAWRSLLLAIIAVSFAAALFELGRDPKSAFYLPYSRAWELALGGLFVFLPQVRGRAAEALTLLGLAAIVAASLYLKPDDPFPGWNALVPVLGAGLVILSGESLSGRLLGKLAPLGLISYSLYLWHWPVIVFWRVYLNDRPLSALDVALIIGLSVSLSILSWAIVEQPLRKARFRSVLVTALAADVAVAAVLAPIVLTGGFPSRIPHSALALGNLQTMWDWPCPESRDVGLFSYPGTERSAPTCIVGAPWTSARHHAVVWGDSNADAILPLLNVAARRNDTAVAVVDVCPAVIHKGVLARYMPQLPIYNDYCEALRTAALKLIDGTPRVDLVILAAAWSQLGRVFTRRAADKPDGSEHFEVLQDGLADLLPKISPGRRVVLFLDVPKWWGVTNDPVACVLARIALPRRPCGTDPGSMPRAAFDRFEEPSHDALRSAASQAGVLSYSPENYLCDATRCMTFVNGEFIYRDGGHLRRDLSPRTVNRLTDLMQLDRLFAGLGQDSSPPGSAAALPSKGLD